MKKLCTLPLLPLLLFTSCKKAAESFTSLSGKVVEQGSNKPIPNAKVYFMWQEFFTFNVIEHEIATTISNDDGTYSLEGEPPNENLVAYAVADQYFDFSEQTIKDDNVERGKAQQLDLTLIPFAWVRIDFINTLGNDAIQINRIIGGGQGFQVSSNQTQIALTYGNQQVEIHCFIDKNNVQVDKKTYTISTIARDTVDLTIEF